MARGAGPQSGPAQADTPARLEVIERLDDEGMLPAIYFIFSRNACGEAARSCLAPGLVLTTVDERVRIREIVDARLESMDDRDLDVLDIRSAKCLGQPLHLRLSELPVGAAIVFGLLRQHRNMDVLVVRIGPRVRAPGSRLDLGIADPPVPDDVFYARISGGHDRVGNFLSVTPIGRIVGDVTGCDHSDIAVDDPRIVVRVATLVSGIADRTVEAQQYRASGLNLVIAAIVYWNSTYMADAAAHLRAAGEPRLDELLGYTSPVTWEHVGLSGDFLWDKAAAASAGRRPLNIDRRRRAA